MSRNSQARQNLHVCPGVSIEVAAVCVFVQGQHQHADHQGNTWEYNEDDNVVLMQ